MIGCLLYCNPYYILICEDDFMEQNEWIVINYTLPREPSRVRVSLWRRLKKIGAVNIQQSMWILPLTDENYDLLNEIKN